MLPAGLYNWEENAGPPPKLGVGAVGILPSSSREWYLKSDGHTTHTLFPSLSHAHTPKLKLPGHCEMVGQSPAVKVPRKGSSRTTEDRAEEIPEGILAGRAWALEYTEQPEGGVRFPHRGHGRARKGQELGGLQGKVAAAPRGSPSWVRREWVGGDAGSAQVPVGRPAGWVVGPGNSRSQGDPRHLHVILSL